MVQSTVTSDEQGASLSSLSARRAPDPAYPGPGTRIPLIQLYPGSLVIVPRKLLPVAETRRDSPRDQLADSGCPGLKAYIEEGDYEHALDCELQVLTVRGTYLHAVPLFGRSKGCINTSMLNALEAEAQLQFVYWSD
eukprot:2272200-Rhodomonas_salina.2